MDKHQYFVVLAATLFVVNGQENCSLYEANQIAYFHWPLQIDCFDVAQLCFLDGDDFLCNISSNNGSRLFYADYGEGDDTLYTIWNVTAEIPAAMEITITSSDSLTCCTKHVRLQAQTLPNYTCPVALSQSKLETGVQAPNLGSNKRITCGIPATSNEPRLDMSTNTVTWRYNCNSTLPPGVVMNAQKQLDISSFNWTEHTGSYICSIERNGMTRYISKTTLCASPERTSAQINSTSIFCQTETIRYNLKETAVIICDVSVGNSNTNPNNYNMNFYPLYDNKTRNREKDAMSCTASLGGRGISNAATVNCSFTRINFFNETCFTTTPTLLEWQQEANKSLQTLRMTYSISNLKASDFGFYEAFVSSGGMSNNSTYEIEIIEDQGESNRAAIIGGALGGTVVFLIIVVCLIYYFRVHLRLLWKRSRCVKHDNNLRDFGAYFVYYWSNEEGRRVEIPLYEELIDGMRKYIQQLGFQIYDPAERPFQFQWEGQNILAVQNNCDRVVVILTSQLLNENNVESNLYSNFLDRPLKFIFIKTPEFDAAFRDMKDMQRKTGLSAHFQRNFTISWSGKEKELSERFKMELELAMPKRKQNSPEDENETYQTRL